jgi:hypothetical protein
VTRDDRRAGGARRACCMISELLEESGIDREHIRAVRRQVLQGIILLCEWQLQRMDETGRPSEEARTRRRGRKVTVE